MSEGGGSETEAEEQRDRGDRREGQMKGGRDGEREMLLSSPELFNLLRNYS